MKTIYPSILIRYLGTIIDMVVVIMLITAVAKVLPLLGVATESKWAWAAILAPILVYEPLLTSKAATLGQLLMRFRIRDVASKKSISIFSAYSRWFVKFLLGGISLLTIPADAKRRAIHDHATDSVAIRASKLSAWNTDADSTTRTSP